MTPRLKFNPNLLPEQPDLRHECELWNKKVRRVAGIDEVGRGALAGPVAVGVVVLPPDEPDLIARLHGVRDSKVMTPEDRTAWAAQIKTIAVDWRVGMAAPDEIDHLGIVPATCLAARRALAALMEPPEHLLVDYLTLPDVTTPQTALVKGDARSLSIAAAAILAKTARDALMIDMDKDFAGYFFANNKGYGTPAHCRAIEALGPCSMHRRTFSPVSAFDSLFPPRSENA